MQNISKVLALVGIVAGSVAVDGRAQDQWPSQYKDAANTASTQVTLPANIGVWWERAGAGQPVVYSYPNGEIVVISGNSMYEAWSGNLLHTFHAADQAVVDVSTGVLLTSREDSNAGMHFFAYDLQPDLFS